MISYYIDIEIVYLFIMFKKIMEYMCGKESYKYMHVLKNIFSKNIFNIIEWEHFLISWIIVFGYPSKTYEWLIVL